MQCARYLEIDLKAGNEDLVSYLSYFLNNNICSNKSIAEKKSQNSQNLQNKIKFAKVTT